MFRSSKFATVAAVALALAGAVAIPAFSAAPQDQPPAHREMGEHHHGMGGHHHFGRWGGARHIEGRIAFMKAELKITEAQAPAFDALAQAMRAAASEDKTTFESVRQAPPKGALDRLDLRQRMAELHAKHIAAFVAAFKPLYDGLSDDQRKAADELMAPHFHRG